MDAFHHATPHLTARSPPDAAAQPSKNALLGAAWTELQSVGYVKLTMERVADRANKPRGDLPPLV